MAANTKAQADTPVINKGLLDGRPEDEDPRARAERRVAELEGHWGDELPPDADTTDRFYIDPRLIPDGWDYAWWPYQVIGKEDPQAWTEVESSGWEPVPRTRHPHLMPEGWNGNTIDRMGQRLMERPLIITQRARAREKWKADKLLGDKEAQLSGAPPGTLPRQRADGSPAVSIQRTREAFAVPK